MSDVYLFFFKQKIGISNEQIETNAENAPRWKEHIQTNIHFWHYTELERKQVVDK